MKALRALCAALLLGAACGPERVPPPAAPPSSLSDPGDAIPGDLDVALRIDIARIRRTLGPELIESLRARAALGEGGGDTGTDKLVADALASADTVWVAFRPGLPNEQTDNVLIVRGDFSRIDPRSYKSVPKWTGPSDLGGAWMLYERERPKGRAQAARIYARDKSILVFVSSAEIDSVERSLEQRMDDAHVAPPAEGVLSVEARTPALAEQMLTRSPAAAKLLKRGTKLRAHADLTQTGLSAELELVLDSEEGARETAEAAALFARALAEQGSDVKTLVRGLKIEAVGESVVARLRLTHDELAAVIPGIQK